MKTPGTCHYCHNVLGKGKTIDHIVPLSKGGEDSGWNKVPACKRCNQRKADKFPTCKCHICQTSIARHAAMGTTEAGPRPGFRSPREKRRAVYRLRKQQKAARREQPLETRPGTPYATNN